ncbi:tRNA-specific adenosine deaminase subunit tad3 [Microbotryomycetes sp. JL201]|nr:tRNA-specific adenosine deaminase subunit tad3 [Microbotryomycetes sp. JL201]
MAQGNLKLKKKEQSSTSKKLKAPAPKKGARTIPPKKAQAVAREMVHRKNTGSHSANVERNIAAQALNAGKLTVLKPVAEDAAKEREAKKKPRRRSDVAAVQLSPASIFLRVKLAAVDHGIETRSQIQSKTNHVDDGCDAAKGNDVRQRRAATAAVNDSCDDDDDDHGALSTPSTSVSPTCGSDKGDIEYSYPAAPPSYPRLTPTLHSAPVEIKADDTKGRGVYAARDILAGTTIDISPVLLISSKEYYGGGEPGEGKGVEGSVLRGYVFTWKGKEGGMALALGLGSLFNHSATPNVSFELDTVGYAIHYKTFKRVNAGDELCIYYGHQAKFDGQLSSECSTTTASEDDADLVWGGLGQLGLEDHRRALQERAVAKAVKKARWKPWEEDIIPFKQLKWSKVTSYIDPEDMPLTTLDCYAIDVPARLAPSVFQFVRKHTGRFDELNHLKRVKPKVAAIERGHQAADAPLSVLLFPVATAPTNLQQLLKETSFGKVNSEPYVCAVPASVARTEEQAAEWGKVWPVAMMHIREGARALPRARGWEQVKEEWIQREAEDVWRAAVEAEQIGECPVACHVTDSFHPLVHGPGKMPKTIVRAIDTRQSTGNCLCHAACNAIDAVAILDRQNLRGSPLLPDMPVPYLLTGLTVFMSHEPCLLCSMSLMHSRIANLFYLKSSPGSGGLGSLFSVHEDGGLNHKFEVWKWRGGGNLGAGLDVRIDP